MKNPDFLGLSKLCVWAFFIFIFLASGFDEGSQGGECCAMVAAASLPLSILFLGAHNGVQQRNETTEERQARQERAAESERRRKENARIVSSELISMKYEKITLEALGRGLFYGALAGNIGIYAGVAGTPKRATKATFRVNYASGRTRIETVVVGSRRYNKLIRELK